MKDAHPSTDVLTFSVKAFSLLSVHCPPAWSPHPATGHFRSTGGPAGPRQGFTLVSGTCPHTLAQTPAAHPLQIPSLDQTPDPMAADPGLLTLQPPTPPPF